MDEIETITFFGAAYLVFYLMRHIQKGRKRKRTTWGRRWIRNRDESGAYKGVIQEVKKDDPTSFKTFMRMDEESFNFLLEKVSPLIKRQDTNMRQAISPGELLSLTLRFLATGRQHFKCMVKYNNKIATIIPKRVRQLLEIISKTIQKA